MIGKKRMTAVVTMEGRPVRWVMIAMMSTLPSMRTARRSRPRLPFHGADGQDGRRDDDSGMRQGRLVHQEFSSGVRLQMFKGLLVLIMVC